MAFRDRFPTLEDLLRASAEDVGAELVLHMQQRRPQQVHEGNLISDLMHLYGAGQQGRRKGPIEVYQGGHYLTLTTERVHAV